jgi:hypothetical protein
MATSSSKDKRSEPWDRDNPKKKSGTAKHLSAPAKAAAKRSAKKAGRPYPNLVDNMRAARKTKATGS